MLSIDSGYSFRRSFNPLFVGVWLLNFCLLDSDIDPEDSFNPLFVGVWLLNKKKSSSILSKERFQSFICWSMAFE